MFFWVWYIWAFEPPQSNEEVSTKTGEEQLDLGELKGFTR